MIKIKKLKSIFSKIIGFAKNIYDKLLTKIKENRFFNALYNFYNKNQIIIDILMICLYKLSLDYIYVEYLSPAYAYSLFTTDFNLIRYALSSITVLIFSVPILFLYRQKTASSIMVILINFIYFIPLMTYYAFIDTGIAFYIMSVIYWAIFMYCQLKFPVLYVKKTNSNIQKTIINFITLIISSIVIFIWARYTNFNLQFDIIQVYETRAEFASISLPTVLIMLRSFASTVIPILILNAFVTKRRFLGIIIFIIGFLNFSIDGSKTAFFMLLVAVISYIFYKDWMIKIVCPLLTAITIASGLMIEIFDNIYPLSMFIRRVMFVPIQLSEFYIKYFSENSLNLFRNGFLDKIGFTSVYDLQIPRLMGQFMGNESSANNGLIGDAFSNLGFVGILIMPIILIVIFRFMDSLSKNISMNVIFVSCVNFSIGFTNSSWSTILLTHGFLVICMLLYIFPSNDEKRLK